MRAALHGALLLGLCACGPEARTGLPDHPGEALPAPSHLVCLWSPPLPIPLQLESLLPLPSVFLEGPGGLSFLSVEGRKGGPFLPMAVVDLEKEAETARALAVLQGLPPTRVRYMARGRELRMRPALDPAQISPEILARRDWFRASRDAVRMPGDSGGGFFELHADPARLVEALLRRSGGRPGRRGAAPLLRRGIESLGLDSILTVGLRLVPSGRGKEGGFEGRVAFRLARKPVGLVRLLLPGGEDRAFPSWEDLPRKGNALFLRADFAGLRREFLDLLRGDGRDLFGEALAQFGARGGEPLLGPFFDPKFGALLGREILALDPEGWTGRWIRKGPAPISVPFCLAVSLKDPEGMRAWLDRKAGSRGPGIRLFDLARREGGWRIRILGQSFEASIRAGWLCLSNQRARAFVARLEKALAAASKRKPGRGFRARGRFVLEGPLRGGKDPAADPRRFEFRLRRAGWGLVGSLSGP